MSNIYVQKPPAVEAVKYDGTNTEEILIFCPDCEYNVENNKLTLYGMEIAADWWIQKDRGGTYAPCAPNFLNYWEIAPAGIMMEKTNG